MTDHMDAGWITGEGAIWDHHAVIFGIDGRMDSVPEGWNEEAQQ